MPIGFIWQTFLETPLINLMVLLTVATFGSFGLAILVFTVITRVLTFPLTLRTFRSTKKLQDIQPRMQELQKKYSDPRRRSEETMKLYKEAGVSPLGCLGPQLLQMPVFIALYQVIRITIGTTPESVLYLQTRLYDLPLLHDAIPLSTRFLFLDMGASGKNPTSISLMVVVFVAMWLQQRISSTRSTATDRNQQQMNQMMQWMMPTLFAWFVLSVPAGLGLYWAATTVIGIVLHWVFIGAGDFTWGSLIPAPVRTALSLAPAGPSQSTTTQSTSQPAVAPETAETRTEDEPDSGNQRSRRRRGDRSRTRTARSQPRSGRRRRRPRR